MAAALRFERERLRSLWFLLPAALLLTGLVAGFDAAAVFRAAEGKVRWLLLERRYALLLTGLIAGFDAAAVSRAAEGKIRWLLLERRYALLPGVLLYLGFWELDAGSGALRLPLLRGCRRREAFGAKLLFFQLANLGTAAVHLVLALLLAGCPAQEALTGETMALLALRLGRDFGLQCLLLLPPFLGVEFFLRLCVSCAWAFCFSFLTPAGEPFRAWELILAGALFLLAAPGAWLMYRKKEL